jgi:hypothetical protein
LPKKKAATGLVAAFEIHETLCRYPKTFTLKRKLERESE